MLVFLIGLSGSGKSYWARQLADAWNWQRLDMDEMIVARSSKSIVQLFEEKGETYFRELEHQLLKDIIQNSSDKKIIIATGGGMPCFHDNIEWMNKHGLVIYLQAQPTLLSQRLLHANDRPLLAAASALELEEKFASMLASRKKIYEQAPVKIDAATATTFTFAQALSAYESSAPK